MEKYVGVSLIIICAGIVLFLLATLGVNTYFKVTKEKIEVQTKNSNFSQNKTTDE